MDNNSVVDDTLMDLDLNQEPVEPSNVAAGGLGTLLDELETAHDQIEERIRRLEAITARARQRQRWRMLHNRHPQTSTNSSSETLNTIPNEVKCGKRDSSHLATVDDGNGGGGTGFFDCNICLEMAMEPVLTCCGHLFCWACFFRLPYFSPSAKECPVCRGEVRDTSIIPIYGNGKGANLEESDRGLKIPPRPQAHRVESLRQRRGGDTGGRWRLQTHEFTTGWPESATSLYSISFANAIESNASSSQALGEDIAPSSSSRVRIRLPTVASDPNYMLFRELRR